MMMKRRGITMTEVLITIFVLAIGLLALLTLFPLAALNMQQAIQDDRVGHAVACACGQADMCNDFRPANDQPGAQRNPPIAASPLAAQYYRLNGAVDDGPSNPVYLDPIGARSGGTTASWVGGQSNGIPRITSPWLNLQPSPAYSRLNPILTQGLQATPQYLLQGFILTDDMVFDQNGIPAGLANGGLERQGNYSWAYMLRRPRTACGAVVDVTVVVYVGRPVYAVNTAAPETVCKATGGTVGGNSLTLKLPTGSTATLRKGTWLLDISPGNTAVDGPINGYFYRVVNVTTSGKKYLVELQTPLRASASSVVLMDNVAEVFEKGAGWQEPRLRTDE